MTKKKPVRDPESIILDDYEKSIDEATNDPNMRISSWPEFEAWKKEMMNASFESIPSAEQTKTVQIPVSIFEKFKQVKESDSRELGGKGLGLAICKSIIEQHGGTIGVDSNGSKGSTFWFEIPLQQAWVVDQGTK